MPKLYDVAHCRAGDKGNTSILSLVAVMVAVHPASVGFRRIMSWPPLVEMGKRSYGLYLWSWPIFVIVGATTGSVSKFLWAMALTVVVAEASYRYLETPVRKGAVGRRWNDRATITSWPMMPIAIDGWSTNIWVIDSYKPSKPRCTRGCVAA